MRIYSIYPCFFIYLSALLLSLVAPSNSIFGIEASKHEKYHGKIRFVGRSKNFGRVIRGEKLVHTFRFKNIGFGPLMIQGVHVACGCTVPHFDDSKKYAPGEEGEITIEFDTSSFVGAKSKAVTVMTNEPLGMTQVLTLKADIASEYLFDPPVVDFGEVKVNQTLERKITITPLNKFPLKVEDIKYDKQKFSVEKIAYKTSKVELNIRLLPNTKSGLLRDEIVFSTNSKFLPEARVVMRADFVGRIFMVPNYLEFGAIDRNSSASRMVTFSGNTQFSVEPGHVQLSLNGANIVDPLTFLKIDVSESNNKHKRLQINLQNKAKMAGSVHGTLSFQTSDPAQEKISIDMYAFFR